MDKTHIKQTHDEFLNSDIVLITEKTFSHFKIVNFTVSFLFILFSLINFCTFAFTENITSNTTYLYITILFGIMFCLSCAIMISFIFNPNSERLSEHFSPKLFNQFQNNFNSMRNFFLDKETIKKTIQAMDFYKSEYDAVFVLTSNNRARNIENEYLEAFTQNNLKKTIDLFFEIRKIIHASSSQKTFNNLKEELLK